MKRWALLLVVSIATLSYSQNLKSRWAATVTPQNVWREYPRPQMVRPDWTNLNGTWTLRFGPAPRTGEDEENGKPERDIKVGPPEKILVPFPVESQLSGVQKKLEPDQQLIYTRSFLRPKGERVLLHFGAVDWKSVVKVNGQVVGVHVGGYDPFTFDITSYLKNGLKQELEVDVIDPTDSNWQPRGKQVLKPGGIFYTSTSGIWQTVWLEAVPNTYIDGLQVDTSPHAGLVKVSARTRGKTAGLTTNVEVLSGGKLLAKGGASTRAPVSLKIANAQLWSPEHPFLYNLRVSLRDGKGRVVDQVTSYFALREIALSKENQPRFTLNGKPYFLIGPLDQGFWPDGIYTAPSDEAMRYDLEITKRLGFNMIRKHVKVEPERWYYWCDKLGIAVLQDMPSGDKYIGGNDPDIERGPESARDFAAELQALVDTHRNHPSIVTWVLYNEGWGQWKTAEMTKWLKAYDQSRLVDSVTGWADRGVGDFLDWHVYPGPGAPPNQKDRAIFLGEFGGLGLPVPGHMWQEKGWGYQSFKTSEELTNRFVEIFRDLRFLQPKGLSGAVYTQTTDCETELNGLMTYDRAMIKMDQTRARKAVRDLFLPPPTVETVVPTSELQPVTWRYSLAVQGRGWFEPGYGDFDWKRAPGGFGTPDTPGSVVRTRWDTNDIYLRRTFTLDRDYGPGELYLRLSHDDDVEVYLDGMQTYRSTGWTTSYKLIYLGKALSKGEHTLAIHCHQNQGGQFVDAGLVRIIGSQ